MWFDRGLLCSALSLMPTVELRTRRNSRACWVRSYQGVHSQYTATVGRDYAPLLHRTDFRTLSLHLNTSGTEASYSIAESAWQATSADLCVLTRLSCSAISLQSRDDIMLIRMRANVYLSRTEYIMRILSGRRDVVRPDSLHLLTIPERNWAYSIARRFAETFTWGTTQLVNAQLRNTWTSAH